MRGKKEEGGALAAVKAEFVGKGEWRMENENSLFRRRSLRGKGGNTMLKGAFGRRHCGSRPE